jgi:hypothetical protein
MARLPDPATQQRWQRLIRQYDDAECSIAVFCDLHEVSTGSFYAWRRRLKAHAQDDGFLRVEVADPKPVPGHTATIHFGCGTRLEIDSRDTDSLLHIVDRLRSNSEGVNA